MSLSNDLISQFVKATKDETKTNTETTVYGTTVEVDGKTYVRIDGSELLTPVSTTAVTKPGERVTVMIKNHTATITGNISSPAARKDDVQDVTSLSNKISEFEIIIADKVDTTELNAQKSRIDNLYAENVTIKQSLSVNEADIDQLQASNIKVTETLQANSADIETLQTTKLDATVADMTYATIDDLEATDAKVYNLNATYSNFVNTTTDKLAAITASIEDLEAGEITVDQLDAKYATIASLDVEKGRINDLEADVADIDTLIFGSATGSTIQTSFANAVIAQLGNAQIKSAMIKDVSADKITSGDIITNNVRVMSEDGKLVISDETIQISDATRVRVQIGKDSAGDYSINIWDADGNLMFSEGGITDSAIKEAIIRNDMVSDTANIAAHKLDIDSLFEEINGSTKTIKSSRVYLDDQSQTLDVAFTTVTTDIEEIQNGMSSQGTEIEVIQGQIASKIWQQDINTAISEVGTTTDNLSTQYEEMQQDLSGMTATVANHTSVLEKKADSSSVTEVSDKVTALETNLSGFKTTVSDTYATRTEVEEIQNGFDSMEIGGRNIALNTATTINIEGKNITNQTMALYPMSMNWQDLIGKTVIIEFDYEFVDGSTATYLKVGMTSTPFTRFVEINPSKGLSGRAHGSITIPEEMSSSSHVGIRCEYFTGAITISNFMFEVGTIPTAWRPAPEDSVTSDEMDALTSRVTTAETSIAQNTSDISLRATKTEMSEALNNIAIGGRNLIRNSKLDTNCELWSFDYNHQTVSFDNGYAEISRTYDENYTSRAFNNQHSGSNPLLIPDEISNETYVLSADLKAIDGLATTKNSSLFWRIYYNETEFEELTLVIPDDLSSTEWRRCYAVKTFSEHEWVRSQVSIALQNADNGICVRELMLEKASKPSAWSPAPEDLEAYSEEVAGTAKTEAIDEVLVSVNTTLENYATLDVTNTKIKTAVSASETTTKAYTDGKVNTALTEANSYTDQTANSITSLVSSKYTTKEEFNGLEVGGRNLIRDSKLEGNFDATFWTNVITGGIITKGDDYIGLSREEAGTARLFFTQYVTSNPLLLPEDGETYTMSGDLKILDGVDLSSGGTVFWRYYYDDGSYGEMAFGIDPALVTEDWKRFYVTKTIVVPDGKTLKPSSAQISVAIGNAIGGVAFRNLKLEKGSTPTNWTPAIEDVSESIASIDEVANDAQSTANNNADRITQAESIIQQLSDSIIMLVTDSNGESLMTQTDTGWTFSTASIQDTVDTTSANLDALISEVGDVNSAVGVLQQAVEDLGILNEYVKITTYEDEPCIELGETDSDFKLLITNTRIMFMEGTGVPAYITNQALHIKKAVVEEELQQGEFVWKARANGNLGLIWKGVTS